MDTYMEQEDIGETCDSLLLDENRKLLEQALKDHRVSYDLKGDLIRDEIDRKWMNALGNSTGCMGITFTLKPYYRDRLDERGLKQLVKNFIKHNKKELLRDTEFKCYLVGEYDDNINYHFHGLIKGFKYKKDMAIFKKKYTEQMGFMKYEMNIENIHNWVNYMFKDAYKQGVNPQTIIDKKSYIEFM